MSASPLRRRIATAALASALLAVAGCATESTYRPATGSGFARSGYSDRQVEPNRYLVSFSGNSYTSRDTVERYLLFRAAELTVQSGNDYFILTERDVDRQTRTYSTPSFGGGFGAYGGWGPSWRYYGRGYGWRSWSPFWGDPFFDRDIDVRTIDRFEATAEIVTGKGPKPRDNVRAFDARAVMDSIGPSVVTPK